MATRTRADLVTQVLENLGILPEGQTPMPEDSARVDRNLPSVLATLGARSIVYVGDIERIPEEYFLPLGDLAAYELRSKFGFTDEMSTTLQSKATEARAAFAEMRQGRPTYEPLKFSSI